MYSFPHQTSWKLWLTKWKTSLVMLLVMPKSHLARSLHSIPRWSNNPHLSEYSKRSPFGKISSSFSHILFVKSSTSCLHSFGFLMVKWFWVWASIHFLCVYRVDGWKRYVPRTGHATVIPTCSSLHVLFYENRGPWANLGFVILPMLLENCDKFIHSRMV